MKKYLFLIFLILGLLLILPLNVSFSQTNSVQCDVCGYCPSVDPNPPSNWSACAKCLYPSIYPLTPVPDGSTLQLDPSTNEPIKPQKGRFYTFLGCINTDLSSFQEEGAAVSVVQTLSNIIFSAVGIIAFLYLLYGAYILATSQANPERLVLGKQIIKRAIIGLVFSLLSFLIIKFIAVKIFALPWFSG